MKYLPRTRPAALLVAMLLAVVASAPTLAAAPAPLATSVAGTTPLNTNLLQNAGFETPGSAGLIPGWTVVGDVHVETFGTRSWPSVAYATKWKGGTRYLACGTHSGLVTQTVDFNGVSPHSNPLKARLNAMFGGTLGHLIRVEIRFTGDANQQVSRERLRALDISNHYKNAVVTLQVPEWATHIQATVELLPKAGAPRCRVVADTVALWIFQP